MEIKVEKGKDVKDVTNQRAKTASFTAEQIREMANDRELGETIAKLIEDSEGNLKGNMAFTVAKALKLIKK